MNADNSTMRRFHLVRNEDVSGTSGTGLVAEGVEFSNGQVVLHWISQLDAVSVYANIKTMVSIHGHEGRTLVEWVDLDEDEDYYLDWEDEEEYEEDDTEDAEIE